MARQKAKPQEILLGENFGAVSVKVNGVTFEVNAKGDVIICTAGKVQVQASASTSITMAKKALEIGDQLEDGTIFAGLTHYYKRKIFLATDTDTKGFNHEDALQYARHYSGGGLRDWQIPTKEDLNEIFKNKDKGALKKAFNNFGSGAHKGSVWTSTIDPSSNIDLPSNAWQQNMNDGNQSSYCKGNTLSVLCVRLGPFPQ